jgi:hypothetical protein
LIGSTGTRESRRGRPFFATIEAALDALVGAPSLAGMSISQFEP